MKIDKRFLILQGIFLVSIGLIPCWMDGNEFLLKILFGPGLVLLALGLSIDME